MCIIYTHIHILYIYIYTYIKYTTMETEAPAVITGKRPPKSWPSHGKLVFKNVKLRYRTNPPPPPQVIGNVKLRYRLRV